MARCALTLHRLLMMVHYGRDLMTPKGRRYICTSSSRSSREDQNTQWNQSQRLIRFTAEWEAKQPFISNSSWSPCDLLVSPSALVSCAVYCTSTIGAAKRMEEAQLLPTGEQKTRKTLRGAICPQVTEFQNVDGIATRIQRPAMASLPADPKACSSRLQM